MLKNILPKDIIDKIFSYDQTYHLKYKELIEEFHRKTAFWNITNNKLIGSPKQIYKYSLTYKQAKNLVLYWNSDYLLNNVRQNPNYKFMSNQQIFNTFRSRSFNYTESLFDFYPNVYKLFFSKFKGI